MIGQGNGIGHPYQGGCYAALTGNPSPNVQRVFRAVRAAANPVRVELWANPQRAGFRMKHCGLLAVLAEHRPKRSAVCRARQGSGDVLLDL